MKMAQNQSDIMKAFSELRDDVEFLRKRQDLVFQKQDIIHSTLAGEIPTRRSSTSEVNMNMFRSPSTGPPMVAWSPVYPNRIPQPNTAPAGNSHTYKKNMCLAIRPFLHWMS